MIEKAKPSTAKEIRRLLYVILGGVVAAFVLTASLLYYYNPAGRYQSQDVLLSPLVLSALSYNDFNPKTGAMSHFVFEKIDFTYYDIPKKQRNHAEVPVANYTEFYGMVDGEKSLSDLTEKVLSQFNPAQLAILTIRVQPDTRAEAQSTSKVFLEVHFAYEGNYYRVQLREEGNPSGQSWAYFYHPGIYDEAMKLFVK